MSGPPLTLARPDTPPRVALRLLDAQRERDLRRSLAWASEAQADVLVVELRVGEAVPADAASFDGALLLLSDDPAHAADLPCRACCRARRTSEKSPPPSRRSPRG